MNSEMHCLEYNVFEVAWGWIGVASSSQGLVFLTLPCTTSDEALAMLGMVVRKGRRIISFAELEEKIKSYFSGKTVIFDDALDLTAVTSFQRRVLLAVRGIAYGDNRSYAWVAAQIDNPKACRAVGQALGKNPLPIVIPCHRVLASGGALGGFSGGLAMKRRFLELEGIHCLGQ